MRRVTSSPPGFAQPQRFSLLLVPILTLAAASRFPPPASRLPRRPQRSRQESERLELELAQSQQEAGLVRRQLSREQQARADYDAQLRALGNGEAAAPGWRQASGATTSEARQREG